ncbi:MAG: metallophosphoesterase [Pseudomonadota bacterium]|nr:metallophosphoesterase [Pseudomonadota bacterium]
MQHDDRPSMLSAAQRSLHGITQREFSLLRRLELNRSSVYRQVQGRRLRFAPVDCHPMVTKELAAPTKAGQAPNRIYAIGDVHGQLAKLKAIHALIRADMIDRPVARARIVHLGDYIDRGSDSAGCLDLLVQGSPIVGVPITNLLGNHEQMLLNILDDHRQAGLWLENGGNATLLSWGIDPGSDPARWVDQIPAPHLQFLRQLVPKVQIGRYLFVHAGVRPGVRLPMQSLADLLWIREGFLDWEGTMLPDAPSLRVVHGHTPSLEPELRPNRLGIDTNAARGGKLTCAALSSDSVYYLQA